MRVHDPTTVSMRVSAALLCFALGCAVETESATAGTPSGGGDAPLGATDSGGATGDETSEPEPPGGASDSSTGTDGDGADDDDGGPLLLDVMPGDVPPPRSMGCTKVDFLFVIDSSASMRHHQDNLAASFPGFIAAIEQALGDVDDFHVMVADTDPNHIAICEQYCDFGSPICSGYACGDAALHWDACDEMYGAGVRHPLGWNASNEDCGLGDARYLTAQHPDLEGSFACAAKVGTSTNAEWQLQSMAAALAPEMTGARGCNDGFLRDDALLVIALITDEPDEYSGSTVQAWADEVIAAKTDSEAIVMLGILPPDVPDPAATCNLDDPDYPKAAPDLHAFVGLFPRSTVGDVCEPDYAPFLVEAVGLIDIACEEFEPAG